MNKKLFAYLGWILLGGFLLIAAKPLGVTHLTSLWVGDPTQTATYTPGDNDLYVYGNVEVDGAIYAASIVPPTEVLTAADTLAAAECGKTLFLNSATEFATALPAISAVEAGCAFKFIVQAAPSGANYTVTSGDSIHGLINVAGTPAACATEDVISFVSGGAVGDWITVVSNGTAWYIDGLALTAAKLTCTNP